MLGFTDTKVTAEIYETRYYVKDDKIEEITTLKEGSFTLYKRPNEMWLYLNGGPFSMQVTPKSIIRTNSNGWTAQVGTKPVKVDGIWGGRNYPTLFVPARSMTKIWSKLEEEINA